MVLKVNPILFEATDAETLEKLSELIKYFIEDHFFWDIDNLIDIFFENFPAEKIKESLFTERFLSPHNKTRLGDNIELLLSKGAYITEMHKFYLKNLNVGVEEGEISLDDALKMIRLPSLVIVENGINDWKFIKGLAKKYENHKSYKTIYKLVNKAIQKEKLIAKNAGGNGGIKVNFTNLSSGTYKGIEKYKLATMFDSDKVDFIKLQPVPQGIVSFMKNDIQIDGIKDVVYVKSDRIFWHMLYKKAIENYLHKEILFTNLTLTKEEREKIDKLDPQDHDLYIFDKALPELDTKNLFPELFHKEWTKDKIEARCSHHLVKIDLPNGNLADASEIEYFLLNLASII